MATRESEERPLLFISHKHSDAVIANVLASFVRMWSGGKVEVFQSTSTKEKTGRPAIGGVLRNELMNYLWRTQCLILLYTSPDQDWGYCMWECGVAMHPQSPDTRMVVFVCGPNPPAVLSDLVWVDPRNFADIYRFTREFLTSEDFFPGRAEPVSRFSPDGPEVEKAARDLFSGFQDVLPSASEVVEEWPAWPFVRIEMNYAQVDRIKEADVAEREEVTRRLLEQEAVVASCDKEAMRLFRIASCPVGTPFGTLVDAWRESGSRDDAASDWVGAIAEQIAPAALWRFPPVRWELMRAVQSEEWYAPVLNWVKRVPAERKMQFDIYFQRFRVDDEGRVEVKVPAQD